MSLMGADEAWQTFLLTAWRPDFDGSAADDAPGEPRGNTHWGVTRATWEGAMEHGVEVVSTDFDSAQQADFAAVLKWACWTTPWADRIADAGGAGVAILLANMVMAAGQKVAVRLLQRTLLRVVEDGIMGPQTAGAAAAQCRADASLLQRLTVADEAWFKELTLERPDLAQDLRGWDRRAEVFLLVAQKAQGLPA